MKIPPIMKIKYFGICGTFVCSLSGQTYNIQGKVVDSGSNPIKGAAVHLLNADKIEFTDDNGEFNITDNSPPVKKDPITPVSRKPFNFPVSLKLWFLAQGGFIRMEPGRSSNFPLRGQEPGKGQCYIRGRRHL